MKTPLSKQLKQQCREYVATSLTFSVLFFGGLWIFCWIGHSMEDGAWYRFPFYATSGFIEVVLLKCMISSLYIGSIKLEKAKKLEDDSEIEN